MRKRVLVLVIVLAGLLAGCGGDPRDAADAYRTRILADQAAADQTQARAISSSLADQAAAERSATSAARVAGVNRFITWLSFAASIGVSGLVLALAVGLSWGAVGAGRAAARAAEVRANLIPMSEATRQFPLLLSYLGRGRFSLANPNSGAVTLLDTGRAEDRRMIAAAGAVQLAGVVAREARRSDQPEGVGVIASGIPGFVESIGQVIDLGGRSHENL